MQSTFKRKIFKITLVFLAGFLFLFVFRMIYGYTSKFTDREPEYISDFFDDFESSRKNYASDKYKYEKSSSVSTKEMPVADQKVSPENHQISVDQKFEKTATVKSRSNRFEQDEKKIKTSISEFKGIIQFEQNSGSKGDRALQLSIGIQPEKFDTFYAIVKTIGNVKSMEITKVDKTNEYKGLNAKKTSLEKIRNSLIELKKQSGKIDEFIGLENRILEIEEQLQGLGVQLGDYDEENEFCTVRFSLVEGRASVPTSFLHRLKTAFEWTINFYLKFILIVVFIMASAFFILLIIDKLKILSGIIKKLSE
jgi:hypothetical protein